MKLPAGIARLRNVFRRETRKAPAGFSRFPEWIWEEGELRKERIDGGQRADGRDSVQVLNDLAASERAKQMTDLALSIHLGNFRGSRDRQRLHEAANQLLGKSKGSELKLGSLRIFADRDQDWNLSGIEAREFDLSFLGGEISNVLVGKISLQNGGDIVIRDSQVGLLEIGETEGAVRVVLENVDVLSLHIGKLADVRELVLKNCRISETYENVGDPKRHIPDWLKLDKASSAALLKWADERGDSILTHFARGHDLALDRTNSRGFEKLFLNVWYVLADFGRDLWLPLMWLVICIAGFAILLFFTGTSFSPSETAGWHAELAGGSPKAQIMRAVTGAVEGVFSPFSVFSARKLVTPDAWWVALIQFFYSYLCLGLLFLFGFSVRRRFKMR